MIYEIINFEGYSFKHRPTKTEGILEVLVLTPEFEIKSIKVALEAIDDLNFLKHHADQSPVHKKHFEISEDDAFFYNGFLKFGHVYNHDFYVTFNEADEIVKMKVPCVDNDTIVMSNELAEKLRVENPPRPVE